MGLNDFHVKANGRLGKGLATTKELLGLLDELEDVAHAEELNDSLAARLQTIKDRELPMLKGTGFIVIDPANPRFNGEEHADKKDAETAGSNLAYASTAGCAIIYAPILVMRPERPTANSQPSELLKQIGLQADKPAAIADSTGTAAG